MKYSAILGERPQKNKNKTLENLNNVRKIIETYTM
jgi:hypothetical protein